MNFGQFRREYEGLPLIKTRAIVLPAGGETVQSMRNQVSRWKNRGLLIELKRGVFILDENDRKVFPSRFFFANQLNWPSYVSLESAFARYGLIPETVKDVTSVGTKKTTSFRNPLGKFVYQHIKPEAFKGYRSFKDEAGLDVFIAEPEKAVVDFLYLNLNRFKKASRDVFRESYRFQNTDILNCRKIIIFASLFKNASLVDAARRFCKFLEEERR